MKKQGIQPEVKPSTVEAQPEIVQYKWDDEDIFKYNGKEFSLVYQNLQKVVSTPEFNKKLNEANETLAIFNLWQLANIKLRNGIDKGFVYGVDANGNKVEIPKSEEPDAGQRR